MIDENGVSIELDAVCFMRDGELRECALVDVFGERFAIDAETFEALDVDLSDVFLLEG